MCVVRELVYESESPTAVSRGIAGRSPGAVVGDGDEDDLVVGDGGVQAERAGRCARGKSVFDGVDERFVDRQSEVLGGVIVNDSVGPAAEASTQRGGVLRGRAGRQGQR